jgi:hypothetical protein
MTMIKGQPLLCLSYEAGDNGYTGDDDKLSDQLKEISVTYSSTFCSYRK